MILDEQTEVIFPNNLFNLCQMRSHNRDSRLDEVEQLVGQAEAVIEVGVFIQAETQLGQLRVGHHLLVRHPRQETHSVCNMQLFNHLF